MAGDLAELDARAGDIAAGITVAEAKLRTALVEGGDTWEVRAFIDRLRAEQSELAAARRAVLAREAEQEADTIASAGASLAAAVTQRLRDRLAVLQPPAMPLPVGH